MLKSYWDGLSKDLHERWVQSWKSTVIGLVLAAGILVVDYTTTWLSSSQQSWAPLAALAVGIVGGMLKSASVKARGAVVGSVLALLLFASPARAAGPGVYCLRGCEQASNLKALPDTQISDVLWAGPGFAVLPFIYNGATHEWANPVAPAISFGIWWRPPGWTATKSLAAANLSLTGDLSGLSHLDPLLTAVFFDNFTIGGGARVNFATGAQRTGVNPLFAIGWQTSLGGP